MGVRVSLNLGGGWWGWGWGDREYLCGRATCAVSSDHLGGSVSMCFLAKSGLALPYSLQTAESLNLNMFPSFYVGPPPPVALAARPVKFVCLPL